MSVPTENSAGATAIRPFTIPVTPEAEMEALRARIAATRWPEKETAADQSQDVQPATIRELVRYWDTDYDFRRFEARLNALLEFMTEIDGLESHAREQLKFDVKGVFVLAAVSGFPQELYQVPQNWAEQACPNLIYFNEVDKGRPLRRLGAAGPLHDRGPGRVPVTALTGGRHE